MKKAEKDERPKKAEGRKRRKRPTKNLTPMPTLVGNGAVYLIVNTTITPLPPLVNGVTSPNCRLNLVASVTGLNKTINVNYLTV